MSEFHYVLTFFLKIKLWVWKRFNLKNFNCHPSILADNLKHVTFWPQEYLWRTSTILNLRFSCLYFQTKRISTFLRIFAFYKDILHNTSRWLLFQTKYCLISFAFLFWKQTWLISANKNCLFTNFTKVT